MAEIKFAFDWLDADGVQGLELHATWAQFALSVDGDVVTRILDERSRTTRDYVYIPLYPLAEWLAIHWWLLFHEVDTPRKLSDRSFVMRHSLRDAREGYGLPPLSFHAQGETIRLEWEQEKLPHYRIEFLSRGHSDVPTATLRDQMSHFIQAVIHRLHDMGVENTTLEEEWNRIESADPEEAEFCVAAAALGHDPYALEDSRRHLLTAIGNDIPPALRSEFFSMAEVDHLDDQWTAVRDALRIGRENRADLQALKRIRSELLHSVASQALGPPWRTGYTIARAVRKQLHLDSQPLPSFEAISEALQTSPVDFGRAIQQAPAPTPLFDALVSLNEKGSPGFVVVSRREESRRFHLCRGFFEFLTDASLEAALLTKAKSDRQARNRAFAAEFLAPADGLRKRVSGQTVSSDEVDELASEFCVSPLVIVLQLENHEIARVAYDYAAPVAAPHGS